MTKDTEVDSSSGALVARRDGTFLGTTAVTYSLSSSEMPDDVFSEVRSLVYSTASGATITLDVDGHVRLPASTLGGTAEYGPLVMLTQNGNFMLAGPTMVELAPQPTLDAVVADATAQAVALSTQSGTGRHLQGSSSLLQGSSWGSLTVTPPAGSKSYTTLGVGSKSGSGGGSKSGH